MELKVNGNTTQVGDGATLSQLLETLRVSEETRGVAVAVNDRVVPRVQWKATGLCAGDSVEVIRAVQGG